jgi:hypothetical protein
MKRYSLGLVLALIVTIIPAATAQDLHKSYNLGAGGTIKIQNISGDILIVGYAGNTVTVAAIATGRDRQLLSIEDLSTANSVDLRVKYPEQSNNIQASVNFEVHVPSMLEYSFDGITSVSGAINIGGVHGRLRLNSVSGGIKATEITGTVSAKTVSGKVEVDMSRLEGTGEMQFSSVSGDVIVIAPGTIGANIELSTLSGALETNFPIQVQEKGFGPGRSARGSVGARSDYGLRLNTISGKVSLTGK